MIEQQVNPVLSKNHLQAPTASHTFASLLQVGLINDSSSHGLSRAFCLGSALPASQSFSINA